MRAHDLTVSLIELLDHVEMTFRSHGCAGVADQNHLVAQVAASSYGIGHAFIGVHTTDNDGLNG